MKVDKVKNTLQRVGSIAGAVSGVALGLLSIVRVFYPDQKPTNPPTSSSLGNGISEIK